MQRVERCREPKTVAAAHTVFALIAAMSEAPEVGCDPMVCNAAHGTELRQGWYEHAGKRATAPDVVENMFSAAEDVLVDVNKGKLIAARWGHASV